MKNEILQFYLQRRNSWFLRSAVLLMLFLTSVVTVHAQNPIKGKVIDDTGVGLPGATIMIKGTSTGTTSDMDGNYSISVVDNDAVLVISFIGYETQEISIGGRSVIDVSLIPDIESLEEVVVVGYGVQRAEAVTGSVVSLDGSAMREVASTTVSQALQGRMAGVQVSQTSTKPGAGMQIRIRGTRSLTGGNDPLVVLDGIPFPGTISDINPNDIKSVDILKDASATAIYGSRGANGVILITTNSGKRGQKAQFSYNMFHGVKDVFAKYPMMSGPEFVALRAESAANGRAYQNTSDESDDTDTDWQDMLYRKGMITSHNIGVTGGTETGSYSFNLGYMKDQGVIPMQNYQRYNMRGSLTQEVGRFRFGFTTNNSYAINNGDNLGPGAALGRSPIIDPYNADGSLKDRVQEQTAGAQWVYTRQTLEALGDSYINEQKDLASYNNIFAEFKIPGVEGLTYRANVGLSFRQSNDGYYEGEGVFNGNPENQSTATVSNSLTTNWAIENILTYDRTFADKHNLNVVALYSAQENKYNRSHMSARDVPSDHFQFYNLGRAEGEIKVDPSEQYYNKSGLQSWMGRVMYSYDDKYMISATLRSDGSSRLASGEKWHTYPALSVGWNVANESFMQSVDLVNRLKLRLGYGQTSNQGVDPYKTLGVLDTRPYNFGTEYRTGKYVTELPNDQLGWEYSTTWNLGLDFAMLDHRLSGTVEYYIQNTSDVLLSVGLPSTSGVGSYTANIGETQNKGIELSLNGLIIEDANGWSWEAGFNLYANRNKLVSLASDQERDEGNWWFVGHPINVIYDYEQVGLWQVGDPHRDILEPGGNDGMIKVKYTGEYEEDGTPVRAIGPDDRQIIDTNSRFEGGFNTRVAYKGFDLTIIGVFKNGGLLNSTLYGSGGYLNTLNARAGNNVKVDYWTPTNTDTRFPAPGGIQSSDNPKYGNSMGYFDASYMKIRAITLGYDFNKSWLNKAGIQSLRLYASVQNPFVLFSPYHDFSGMDPETNSEGDQNAAVPLSEERKRILTIGTNTPSTRNYLIGLNLTF